MRRTRAGVFSGRSPHQDHAARLAFKLKPTNNFRADAPVDYERLFLDNLGVVNDVVRHIARRHYLSAEASDELASAVRLKIIENDYFILRRFEGRSTLRTYLTAVIQRFFLDTRIAQWGKWRPSAQARRLGPTAVLVDRLMTRDGLSLDEALETLRSVHRVEMTRAALESIALQLPSRSSRRFVGEEHLATLPTPTAADPIEAIDCRREADRIEDALHTALLSLDPDDRLILKMRFHDNLQIARIARILGLTEKPLYRRFERVIGALRRELEALGVSREQVAAVVGSTEVQLNQLIGGTLPENPAHGPSL
jgi:RNA polymerase sigma factor (sigma-70 family)